MNKEPVSCEGAKPVVPVPDGFRTNEILQKLMLGLIYPAVLGTIMYSGMDAFYAQLTFVLSALGNGVRLTADPDTILKFFLLAVTLAFYVCDYLYIMFTRQYRKWFFVFDLVFLAGLYATVQVLDLSNKNQPLSAANGTVIAFCYLIFMALYYLWDSIECPHEPGNERQLYERVLQWEKWSIGCLVGWLIVDGVLVKCLHAHQHFSGWLLLVILIGITAFFGKYTWRKRKFCN